MSVRVRGHRLYLDFYYRGIRCRESLQLEDNRANRKHAERELASIELEMSKGIFDYASRFPNSKKLQKLGITPQTTVSEELEKYLSSLSKRAARSTLKGYKSAINFSLKPAFGEKNLTQLTTANIRDWINIQTVSNKRINNILVPLRGMLAQAHLDGLISVNPVSPIKNLRLDQKEPHPFSDGEIRLILETATGQTKNFFQFAFFTGLRTSELIALTWDDIDLNKGVIYVNKASVQKVVKETKTSSGIREVRILPMTLQAIESQKSYTSNQSQVFNNPNSNKPWIDDQQIRKVGWIPLLKSAGLEYRNPYQTRHTYASMLLTAGENPMWVAQQMGHKDWGMIRKRYGRWIPANDPHAGERISSKWAQFGHKVSASD